MKTIIALLAIVIIGTSCGKSHWYTAVNEQGHPAHYYGTRKLGEKFIDDFNHRSKMTVVCECFK